MTFSSVNVIIHRDLTASSSNGFFYKNPLRGRCLLIYLVTKMIIVCMYKAVDFYYGEGFLFGKNCFLKESELRATVSAAMWQCDVLS